MSVRTKHILIYLGGIITGVILTFVMLFCVAISVGTNRNDNGREMFDKPSQEIDIRSFKVIQVLSDGSALANGNELGNYGVVVLFVAEEGDSYYDDQKIEIPSGKILKQVGVYRYVSRKEVDKTIPIVKVFDE